MPKYEVIVKVVYREYYELQARSEKHARALTKALEYSERNANKIRQEHLIRYGHEISHQDPIQWKVSVIPKCKKKPVKSSKP